MKKLKHNKLRNTGLIFEILTRMSMVEVLNGSPTNSIKIIKRHFKPDSVLYKELKMYESLSKQERSSYANDLVNFTIQSRKKLNETTLNAEKFNLVKSIKNSYDLDSFFGTRVTNYKLLASIYKILEHEGSSNPDDYIASKTLVFEHITGKPTEQTRTEDDEYLKEASADPDIVKLGFKLIVEKFNGKYKDLNLKQKTLLSQFINGDTNSPEFKKFIYTEVKFITTELGEILKEVTDDVTRIKLTEAVKLTQEIVKAPLIKDEHLSSMLKYYELIEVLNNE